MIVSQIHLEGFGQFRDRRIELGRSLTLIHGPNEAGKSTLRAFLTWMLFGTRQGRGGEGARWQPHSGSIAGRLLLVHEERQYLIRRTGPTLQVHGPQLPSAGEEALATLLPRADRNLFEMVFSVDGFDLAKAAALTGQRVQEVLMAGAFTGTRMAPTQAIERLNDAAKTLWGQRSGHVRELLREIGERQRSLREAKSAALAYTDKSEEMRSLEARILEMDQARGRAEARALRLQRLLRAIDPHAKARRLDADLEPLRGEPLLDESVIASLREAIQAERSARSVEAEASRSLTAAERDVAEVVVDKRILAVGPQIERRFGELGKLEDRIRVLPALAERESQAKRRLSAHLASLGKDWTVDVLDAVDVSAARVAEAEDLARAVVPLLDRVPEDEHRATEALKDTTSRRHQARDALDRTAMAPQTAALLARIERLLEREADVQRDAAQRLELAAEIERLSADATPSDAGVPELDESVIEEVDGWRRKLEEAEATLRAGLQSARERVQSAEETVSLSRAELGCIVRDRMAEGLTTRVAALEDALRSLPSLVERANASRREAAATRQEIAVKLSALGVPTSALSGLDPSHAVIHRLQDSVNAQREAVNQQKLANAALDEARRRVRESAIAAGPSAEVVESRRQALTRLRAAFEDVVAADTQAPRSDRGATVAWAGVFAFAAIAALAAASAAWIASAAAAALAAVAALAAMSWLRPVRLMAPDIGPALRELKEAARALGLEARPTRADVERIGATIEKEEREAAIAAEQRRSHELASQRAADAEAALALARQRLVEASVRLQATMREARLPASVPPEVGPQWLADARDAALSQAKVAELDEAAQVAENEAASLVQRLTELCQPLGIAADAPDLALAELRARTDRAEALLDEHDRGGTRLHLAEEALAEAQAQFDRAANARVPPEITVAWAALAAAHRLPAEGPDTPLVARLRAARGRGRLARRLAQIRARTEEIEAKRGRHGEAALALALEAGIPQAEPELAIAALRRLLKQASEAQARRPDLEAALAAAEGDVAKAERDVKDAEALRRKLDDGTRRFAAWRMAVRAPADLSPAGALGWVKALREATAAAESARSASAEIGLARNDLARMRAAVDAVATDLGEPSVQDDEEGVARIHEWKRRLDAARTARTALGEREAARSRACLSHADARAALVEARDSLAGRLAEAGVGDADDLASRIERQRRRQQLGQQIAALEAECAGILGGLAADSEIKVALAEGDPSRWEVESADAQAEAQRLRQEHQAAIEERGRLNEELNKLGSDARVAELSGEIEERQEELERLRESWARERMAAWLMERTFEKYRRERQPEVLRCAGHWMKAATDGAYVEVEVEHGGDGFAVRLVTRDAARVDADSLSAGTRGLLYLCLRLALAGVFAKNSAPLPIVLDDVLVYLDPERAVGATKMLAEVAESHQILLMTCRPETVALVKNAIPFCCEVSLPRWDGSDCPAVVVSRTARYASPASDDGSVADAPLRSSTPSLPQELVALAERAIAVAGQRGISKDDLRLALEQEREEWEGTWPALRQTLLDTGRIVQEGERRGARYLLRSHE